MGTNNQKQQKHSITLSKGGDVPARKINPTTSATDRSFAQPSEATPQPVVTPKVHASETSEAEAVRKNSQLRQEAKVPEATKKVEKKPEPKQEKKVEKKDDDTTTKSRANGALPKNDRK